MQAECYRVHILVIKHLLGVRKTQLRTGSLSPTYETDLSWVFEWARRKWLLLTCCNLSSAMIKSYGHICCWCGHGHAMLHWSLLFTRWPILLGQNLATWPVAQLSPQVEKKAKLHVFCEAMMGKCTQLGPSSAPKPGMWKWINCSHKATDNEHSFQDSEYPSLRLDN